MEIQAWCETDVGLRRERNEDSFAIDEKLKLYIVADGMGGHRGGQIASSMAVEVVREIVRERISGQRKPSPRVVLSDAYREASRRVYDHGQAAAREEGLQGMGTTLVTAYCVDGVLYIANVGDSRAYLFSSRYLWRITEDHSLMNEQLRAGLIRDRDVAGFAAKNIITRSVGYEREVTCDIIERALQPGEMILICSDGLHGLVSDERIQQICRELPPEKIVPTCIEEAKHNGGDDNVTVLLLDVGPAQAK